MENDQRRLVWCESKLLIWDTCTFPVFSRVWDASAVAMVFLVCSLKVGGKEPESGGDFM